VNNEFAKGLEVSGRGLMLRFCSSICMQGVMKTTKNLSDEGTGVWAENEPGTSEY
jgi:hypothetical protein